MATILKGTVSRGTVSKSFSKVSEFATQAVADATGPVFTSATSGQVYYRVDGVVGPTVYTAQATDRNDITYSLGGTNAGDFVINSTTGAVSLNTSGSPSVATDKTFTVTATDSENNATTTSNLTIKIVADVFTKFSPGGVGDFCTAISKIDINAHRGTSDDGHIGVGSDDSNIRYEYYESGTSTSKATVAKTLDMASDGKAYGKLKFAKRGGSVFMAPRVTRPDENAPYDFTVGDEIGFELIRYNALNNSSNNYYGTETFNIDENGTGFVVTASGQTNEQRLYLSDYNGAEGTGVRDSIRLRHSSDTSGIATIQATTPTGTEVVVYVGASSDMISGLKTTVENDFIGEHKFVINNGDGTISFADSLADAQAGIKLPFGTEVPNGMSNFVPLGLYKIISREPFYLDVVDDGLTFTNATGLTASNPHVYTSSVDDVTEFTFATQNSVGADYTAISSTGFDGASVATPSVVGEFTGTVNLANSVGGSGTITVRADSFSGISKTQVVHLADDGIDITSGIGINYISSAQDFVAYTFTLDANAPSGATGSNFSIKTGSVTGFDAADVSINSSTGEVTLAGGTTGNGGFIVQYVNSVSGLQESPTISLYQDTARSIKNSFEYAKIRQTRGSGLSLSRNWDVVDIKYTDDMEENSFTDIPRSVSSVNTSSGNANLTLSDTHGLTNGDRVKFVDTTGTLPTGTYLVSTNSATNFTAYGAGFDGTHPDLSAINVQKVTNKFHLMIKSKTVPGSTSTFHNDHAIGWIQVLNPDGTLYASFSPQPGALEYTVPGAWKTSTTNDGTFTDSMSATTARDNTTTNVSTATNVSHKWCLDQDGTPSGGTGPLNGFTHTAGNNSIYNTQVLPVGDQILPQVDASTSKYLYRETSGTTSGRVSFLKSAATPFPSNGIIRMGVFVAGQTLPAGNIEALAVALVED